MDDVTHEHGMFTWTDLGLPDDGAGTDFYTKLFGWDSAEESAGEHGTYTMLSKSGKSVGGLYKQAPEQQSAGIPPMWLSYVLVDDVDGATARVGDLGGTVITGPMDVMSAGRMSVIQDPTGGVVALWEARGPLGCRGLQRARGNDVERARNEGRSVRPSVLLRAPRMADRGTGDAGRYAVQHDHERRPPERRNAPDGRELARGIPSHWMVYFSVDDVDASAARVSELGGSISVPPTDISVGRFAVVGDPQGGTFTIFKPDQ